MMGLRDIGATLPPGFRFYPSDEELVCHYLYNKIANQEVLKGTLVEIDLHTCEPWQLPEVAKLNANEWYFFSFRDRKYATGFRTNRATTSGYWKATGKDRTVVDPMTKEVVGMRKTLVFYRNRAPNGIKTGWIMHEFRLETPHMPPKEDWVLCRVFHKSKGDDSMKLTNAHDRQLMFEHTCGSSPSPITDQQQPSCVYHRQFSSLSTTSPLQHQNQSFLNLLQCSDHQEFNKTMNTNNNPPEISSKADPDHFGFLWDMNMEDSSLCQGGVASNLDDDIRFEIDNSMVFV